MQDLLKATDEGPSLGDGGAWTTLKSRGCLPADGLAERLVLEDEDAVLGLHRAFLEAGADWVRTNTFRANAPTLASYGLGDRVNELNWTAARIARQAVSGSTAFVIGSVGPLPDGGWSVAERKRFYLEQLGALLDGGVQAIALETFGDVEELGIAIEAKCELHHCPVVAMLSPLAVAQRTSEEVRDLFQWLAAAGADCVGINCGGAEQILPFAREAIRSEIGFAALVTPVPDAAAEEFAAALDALILEGACLVGGCCGASPEHIRAARRMINQRMSEE